LKPPSPIPIQTPDWTRDKLCAQATCLSHIRTTFNRVSGIAIFRYRKIKFGRFQSPRKAVFMNNVNMEMTNIHETIHTYLDISENWYKTRPATLKSMGTSVDKNATHLRGGRNWVKVRPPAALTQPLRGDTPL